MSPPACRHLAVRFQDRRSLLRWDLGEPDRARPASLDEGLSARRADVAYPFRSVAEHRDQVALPVVLGDDEDVGVEQAGAPPSHLQCEKDTRR